MEETTEPLKAGVQWEKPASFQTRGLRDVQSREPSGTTQVAQKLGLDCSESSMSGPSLPSWTTGPQPWPLTPSCDSHDITLQRARSQGPKTPLPFAQSWSQRCAQRLRLGALPELPPWVPPPIPISTGQPLGTQKGVDPQAQNLREISPSQCYCQRDDIFNSTEELKSEIKMGPGGRGEAE